MSFDFAKYTKQPQVKEIHYKRGVMGMSVTTDDPAEAVATLKVRYLSRREQQKILAEQVDRRVVNRKGAKAYIQNEERAQRMIAERALVDFKMTVAGAELFQAELDFEKLDGAQIIPYDDQSRDWFFKHSQIVGVIVNLLSDHEFWFGSTGDDSLEDPEGNVSGDGPSSNTDS